MVGKTLDLMVPFVVMLMGRKGRERVERVVVDGGRRSACPSFASSRKVSRDGPSHRRRTEAYARLSSRQAENKKEGEEKPGM